jgi:hypothetical protein
MHETADTLAIRFRPLRRPPAWKPHTAYSLTPGGRLQPARSPFLDNLADGRLLATANYQQMNHHTDRDAQ